MKACDVTSEELLKDGSSKLNKAVEKGDDSHSHFKN